MFYVHIPCLFWGISRASHAAHHHHTLFSHGTSPPSLTSPHRVCGVCVKAHHSRYMTQNTLISPTEKLTPMSSPDDNDTDDNDGTTAPASPPALCSVSCADNPPTPGRAGTIPPLCKKRKAEAASSPTQPRKRPALGGGEVAAAVADTAPAPPTPATQASAMDSEDEYNSAASSDDEMPGDTESFGGWRGGVRCGGAEARRRGGVEARRRGGAEALTGGLSDSLANQTPPRRV
jgi:hypothetical protein